MTFLLYPIAFLPSIVWLLFYLKKDSHPEPNKMVITTFFLGMVGAFYALVLELAFRDFFAFLKTTDINIIINGFSKIFLGEQEILKKIVVIFFGIAFMEEFAKYIVVRLWVFKSKELDEPPDIMLYMIISALGFAALENGIYILGLHQPPQSILFFDKAVTAMFWRFISATFLHTLCSGTIGYFIALSFCNIKKRKRYFLAGFCLSVFLHGLYNWYIMEVINVKVQKDILLNQNSSTPFQLLLYGLLFVFGIMIALAFRHLKKLKTVCIINSK